MKSSSSMPALRLKPNSISDAVRQVKIALIKSVSALGALDAALDIFSVIKACLYLELALEGKTPRGRPPKIPEPVDPLATMPVEEPGRTTEAIRRALPQLLKLDRYESRAAARRDRAIREIAKRRKSREAF